MAPSRIVDQLGTVLGGRYRLIAPIGTGASAHVYLADDVSLRRRVAVKVLHAALAGDESFLRRFRAEAQAVAALRHPHLMSVHDWGEDEHGPYLVLEHLGGGSLRDLLDRGERLSVAQAARVGLEAAQGLAYAHRRGLVHRDVKPANLLFDDEGRLAIADFGLARALAEAAWTEPTGSMIGTARYASPEQAKGGSMDGKSDVYALALTLVEAVTGRVPFAADTTIGTLMARVDRPLEVPDELGELRTALVAAGAAEPADRIDAAGLVRRLEDVTRRLDRPTALPLAGSGPIDLTEAPSDPTQLPESGNRLFDQDTARLAAAVAPGTTGNGAPAGAVAPEGWASPSGGEHGAGGAVGVDDPDDDKPVRRRRWLRVSLVLIVVAALAVGGGYVWTQSQVPTYPVPQLRELDLAAAQTVVADEQFTLEVVAEEFDEDTAAGQILNQEPAQGELKEGSTIRVVLSKGPEPRPVPSLADLPRDQAEAALTEAGFVPEVVTQHHEQVPAGTVISWSPTADDGAQEKGTTVQVVVSAGPEPRPVPNPSLVDRLLDPFRGLLEDLGLREKREEAFSDTVPAGHIISTKPAPGEKVERGGTVTVVISKGPELVTVPNVNNMTVSEATDAMEAAGLQVVAVRGNPNRLVVGSDPKAGAQVKKGTGVTLQTR